MSQTKRPNFFIIGAPKCGTTALAQYLGDHPNIFMSKPKEPNFFTRDFPVYQQYFKDIDEYEQLFSAAQNHHYAIGEASVWYLYSQTAVSEILSRYPDAKFIALVRNPVDMAMSLHSQMLLMREETVEDFFTAWQLQEKREQGIDIPKLCREPTFLQYRKVCSLGEQVDRLLKITGGKNTKIIFFDDLTQNTRETYVDVLKFLNLEDDGRNEFPIVNANRIYKSSILHLFIIRSPKLLRHVIKPIKKIFGIKRFNFLEKIFNYNTLTKKRHSVSQELRELILRDMEVDVNLLSKISRKNLDKWR